MTTQHLSPLTMLLSQHTRRRHFIKLLGGAAAWPLAARAQQADRVRSIGVIVPLVEDDAFARAEISAFVAAKQATSVIPIVFAGAGDPVANNLVASLARPGGNVTGVVHTVVDLAAKQLGLLHELAPKAAIIAVLGDSNQPELEVELRETERPLAPLGGKS